MVTWYGNMSATLQANAENGDVWMDTFGVGREYDGKKWKECDDAQR